MTITDGELGANNEETSAMTNEFRKRFEEIEKASEADFSKGGSSSSHS